MEPFKNFKGKVAPLDKMNVDTDQIIPKQFLSKITRDGFGIHLFHDWRYLDISGNESNPDFILNKPQYQGASIFLTRENFGCGSSREHAPWALEEYGFKVIIAPSFADIFYGNCINIGLLPIKLSEQQINELFDKSDESSLSLTIDLINNNVTFDKTVYNFSLDSFHQYCLEQGVDSVGWTLNKLEKIKEYEAKMSPWQ